MDIDFENWIMEKSRIWCSAETDEEIEARQAALDEYRQVAEWCNSTGDYTIEDDGTFYRVVKVKHDEDIEESAGNGAESEAENE